MILFLNVYITDDGISVYDRGLFGPAPDRLNVFKYTLASFAPLPWSSVYINCELAPEYKARAAELEAFVYSLFPQPHFSFSRCTCQKQWQEFLSRMFAASEDELIWYFCNDDHVFVDYDLDVISRIETRLLSLNHQEQFVSSLISHYPESVADVLNERAYRSVPGRQERELLELTRDYFAIRTSRVCSMQIVNRRLLEYWWFSADYGDTFLPRTDFSLSYGPPIINSPSDIYCLLPLREQVRHYDGYSHAGIDINRCPPLLIPDGFFDGGIRISYNSDEIKSGWVNINPLNPYFSCVLPCGTDYRFILEDVPVFWKSRISEIQDGKRYDADTLLRARNQAELDKAWSALRTKPPEHLYPGLTRIAMREMPDGSLQFSGPTVPLPVEHDSVSRRNAFPGRRKASVIAIDYFSDHETKREDPDSLPLKRPTQSDLELIWNIVRPYNAFNIPKSALRQADLTIQSYQFALWAEGTCSQQRGLLAALALTSTRWIMVVDGHAFFNTGTWIRLSELARQGPTICDEKALYLAALEHSCASALFCLMGNAGLLNDICSRADLPTGKLDIAAELGKAALKLGHEILLDYSVSEALVRTAFPQASLTTRAAGIGSQISLIRMGE